MMNLATGGQIAPEPGDTFYGIDQRKMSNQEILAMMTEKKRRHARTSLISFTEMTMPRYKSGWFNRQLAYELELFWRGIQDGIMPHLMVFAPPRHGKLCADDTPVPTPKGYQRHGDLKIGDQVYAADGSIANVMAVSEKAPSDMRVEFTNGEVIYCHENHECWQESETIPRRRGETRVSLPVSAPLVRSARELGERASHGPVYSGRVARRWVESDLCHNARP